MAAMETPEYLTVVQLVWRALRARTRWAVIQLLFAGAETLANIAHGKR